MGSEFRGAIQVALALALALALAWAWAHGHIDIGHDHVVCGNIQQLAGALIDHSRQNKLPRNQNRNVKM